MWLCPTYPAKDATQQLRQAISRTPLPTCGLGVNTLLTGSRVKLPLPLLDCTVNPTLLCGTLQAKRSAQALSPGTVV